MRGRRSEPETFRSLPTRKATTHVFTAEGDLHAADPRELTVCDITVNLQHVAEASDMLNGLLGLLAGRVAVGDRGQALPPMVNRRANRTTINRVRYGFVPGRAPALPSRRRTTCPALKHVEQIVEQRS